MWITLITALPTENATLRQRIWRGLKASGAAILRDGVYLLPDRPSCLTTFNEMADELRTGGGTAHLMRVEEPEGLDFVELFDRSKEFGELLAQITSLSQQLQASTVNEVVRQTRKLRKVFYSLAAVDFFPAEAQRQTDSALEELEHACESILSPNEPKARDGVVVAVDLKDFQGKRWATRERPKVDRLASAWLIRRFIDPKAEFLWIQHPTECPTDAIGFDFDGARFTHIGGQVTFEVLATSFALHAIGVARLGQLVHYLDVGGVQPLEAAGIENALTGMRENISDDHQLLDAASHLFDGLFSYYNKAI